MYYVLREYICSMYCMKGSVLIHFRNSEMDEGYFVDFLFLFCPVRDKTIGGGYILKPFLSTSPCLPHFFFFFFWTKKEFLFFQIFGEYLWKKNDWVLKPEYGTSLFFLFSSFLWVMRFITCMNVSKKKIKRKPCT